ncbi:DNA-binding MarR family transcriptional regulator [Catalinimonas alkaloidigena]|uniref:ArsR family transcriptional regulator n=1 Tax=Catalinimonas alkaloidigena TaxID=1075417 RepID=UPI002406931E|nr:ArsR family transcriptional regulator [Catalinimonas alkaloidigena]MDF9800113.1 DNA-binding MarR family transcriptional regulator [Catalinimonas alkaloidigena]
MKSLEKIDYAEAFFKLFTTKGRIRVANILVKVNEISVNEIADIAEIEQSMCSRYLDSLKKNRLASYRRDAQTNYYSYYPEAKELLAHVLAVVQDLEEIQKDNQELKRRGYLLNG